MTDQQTLVEFLEARLADDERIAKAALGETEQTWSINTEPHLPAKHVQGRPSIQTGGMGWQTDSGDGIWSCDDQEDDCWIYRNEDQADAEHIVRFQPKQILGDIASKRAIIQHASNATVNLPEWRPDCGGDWVLSGPGFFANYWPDNTVSASILDEDEDGLDDSGIVAKDSRAACQAFAEDWIRQHLPERNVILRHLAAAWREHAEYNYEWAID